MSWKYKVKCVTYRVHEYLHTRRQKKMLGEQNAYHSLETLAAPPARDLIKSRGGGPPFVHAREAKQAKELLERCRLSYNVKQTQI